MPTHAPGAADDAHFIHMLGKQARLRIVELLVERRGVRAAAELLGVSPAAVSKFLNGDTAPSDKVVARAFMNAGPGELEEMLHIALEEFLRGAYSLAAWIDESAPSAGSGWTARELRDAAQKLRKSIYEIIVALDLARRGRR